MVFLRGGCPDFEGGGALVGKPDKVAGDFVMGFLLMGAGAGLACALDDEDDGRGALDRPLEPASVGACGLEPSPLDPPARVVGGLSGLLLVEEEGLEVTEA